MIQSFEGADGVTYNMAPLSLGDVREFHRYVQFKDYTDFTHLKGTVPDELFESESKKVFERCAAKDKQTIADEVAAFDKSTDGVIHLVWMAVKKHHPNISLDKVFEVVTMENCENVFRKFLQLQPQAPQKKTDRPSSKHRKMNQ